MEADIMDGNKKINICIVHYNTPYLTECLIKSINKTTPNTNIYIFDNSDKYPFIYRQDNIIYLDNTKGEIIDFKNFLSSLKIKGVSKDKKYASAFHTYSIEKCMEIIDDNFILLDSDVLVKKNLQNIVDDNSIFVGQVGEIVKYRKVRVFPFCCFINVKMCQKYNVKYFNKNYMIGINNGERGLWDTGSYFYSQASKYNHKKIKINNYIVHLSSASLKNTPQHSFLEKYKNLYYEKKMESTEKLYVSMTSWTKRIINIPIVLGTILKQSKMPDKIFINLSKLEFPDGIESLPSEVKDFILQHNNIIEIIWHEDNIRQWKKTIPTMLKYPNDYIICIDDDRKYPSNFISTLWETHLKYPNNPITVNRTYKLNGKYLQHAGHGTLDSLKWYGGFKNCLGEELYKMASSDSFFTLIANQNGHPMVGVEKHVSISMYNEINPLKKSENTCSSSSHKEMFSYLKDKGLLNNLNSVPKITNSVKKDEILQNTYLNNIHESFSEIYKKPIYTNTIQRKRIIRKNIT